MTPQKIRLLQAVGIIGFILAFPVLILLEKAETVTTPVKAGVIVAFIVLMTLACACLVIADRAKKKLLSAQAEKTHANADYMIALHCRDSAINEIIFDLAQKEPNPLSDALRNTDFHVDMGYYEESNTYYLVIMGMQHGALKSKVTFSVGLCKDDGEEVLISDGTPRDVSHLSKDDLVGILLETVRSHTPEESSDPTCFTITSPKWTLYVLSPALAVMIAAAIALSVLVATHVLKPYFLWLLLLPAVLGALSAFGLYMYFTERFTLENDIFTYRGVFKTQTCNAHDIVKLRFVPLGSLGNRVFFLGEDDRVLLKFLDDGTVSRVSAFRRCLNHYGIETEYKDF